MKAAVAEGLGKLEIWDIPEPELGPYDVLCRLRYGSTCAGTDLHLMDGKHPFPVSFPTILGHESVGRVIGTGSKVKNFKLGDLVSRVGCPAGVLPGLDSNWGGFSEYGVAKDHWQMRRDGLPSSEWNRSRVNQIIHPQIDERTAPMIITWRETLSYSMRIGISAGSRVLLIGSGANALSFAAHACNLGADITVTGSRTREEIFRRLPIHAYCDYRSEHLSEEIDDQTGGTRFDILLDGVGSSATVNQVISLLRNNAVIGVYGWNNRSGYGLNPFLASGSFHIYAGGYDEEEANSAVQSMILSGRLRADLWYDSESPFPLSEIANAYQKLRLHSALKYLIQL